MSIQLRSQSLNIVLKDTGGSELPDLGIATYTIEDVDNSELHSNKTKRFTAADLPTADPVYGDLRTQVTAFVTWLVESIKADEGI